MKKILAVIGFIFIAAAFASGENEIIDSLWFADLEPFPENAFIAPEVCERCHSEIYEMWDGSMHSGAFDDVLFRSATKLFVKDTANDGEREDAEHCVVCHNPIAYRTGAIPGSSGDYDNTDEVTSRAISCDMCHTIDEIVMVRNTSFNTSPGNGEDEPGIKRGPRGESMAMFHETEFSSIHTSSEICGSCHNVTHLWYMTKLEGTYDEWYHSPYNSADSDKRINCQDCHMRQSPGKPATGMTERPDYPGTSAEMGEERPHIWRHSVVGANVYMPEILGNSEKVELARERLKKAAVIEIMPGFEKSRLNSLTVRVINEGAGHMLPTGVSEFRQMWLEVTITDKRGKTVFESGVLGEDGALPEDTHIFHTVFGDSDGNPTLNVVKASRMLYDHRIHPGGFCDETFVPVKPLKKPLTVKVELKYRSMDPAVVGLLLGDDAPPVPVVTMTDGEVVLR
ncbi:multiheme c-type cytochrome [Candidatus Latescibacterota bacterium]